MKCEHVYVDGQIEKFYSKILWSIISFKAHNDAILGNLPTIPITNSKGIYKGSMARSLVSKSMTVGIKIF